MMELQTRKSMTKNKFANIKTYGKHELKKLLGAAKDEKASTLEFADEIWTTETLASYIMNLQAGCQNKEQDDKARCKNYGRGGCSLMEGGGSSITKALRNKRPGTCQRDNIVSKKVKTATESTEASGEPKTPSGSEHESHTHLSFNEQLQFEDETAFVTYQKSITDRKGQLRKKHFSELRKARKDRKEAAAVAMVKTAAKFDDVIAKDNVGDQPVNNIVIMASGEQTEPESATYADSADVQVPSLAAASEKCLTTAPKPAEKRSPTGLVSIQQDLTPYRNGFWSGRADKFTQQQKDEIEELSKSRPKYLYHVHSRSGQLHTQGSIDEKIANPAAAVESKNIYPSIYDFPSLSELIENFGCRILWQRRYADQFSSYTTSLLFAFVHALGRKIKGETEITISCIDTSKVCTRDGDEVEFYYVPDLLRILHVADWKGWIPKLQSRLMTPCYSHEYVIHGSIELGEGPFRMVPFEYFERAGIYDFFPGLYDKDVMQNMKRLYSRCVEMRVQRHGSAIPASITVSYAERAHILAGLFNPHDVSTSDECSLAVRSAPFQIFVDFVGLSRRWDDHAVLPEYIKPADVRDVIHPRTHIIPNNLPESMQALEHIEQACAVFSLPPIPTHRIICVDVDFDFRGRCLRDLAKKFAFRRPTRMLEPRKPVAALTQASSAQGVVAASDSTGIDGDSTAGVTGYTSRVQGVEQSDSQSRERAEDAATLQYESIGEERANNEDQEQ
nr:hypothetical protein CFP56_24541 [Quercus suber]